MYPDDSDELDPAPWVIVTILDTPARYIGVITVILIFWMLCIGMVIYYHDVSI